MRLLIFAAVVVLPLCGQDSVPAEWREKVEAALKEGRERVALALLAKQLESAHAPADALELFADVAWNVGEFDRAEAAGKRWLDEHPGDARARVCRARQLWNRGQQEAALELLAPVLAEGQATEGALKWNFPAVALAAAVHADRGEDEAAGKLYDQLIDESQRVVVRAAPDLAALAEAVAWIGGKAGVDEAERDLIAAQKAGGGPEVDVALGKLYLHRKYRWADGVAEAKAAIEKRPGYGPAQLLLSRSNEGGMKREEAKAALEKAASISPGDPNVLAEQVFHDLDGFEPEKAAEKVARGLAVNPRHKKLLSLQAAREIVLSRKAEGEKVLESVLKLDPTYGEGLRIVARVLNERRRWPESLELMKRAVAIDPKDPELFDDCARYSLYLGQNAVAEDLLKKADDADAYSHPWRTNMWELLRWIGKKYATVETDKFQVRLFKDDLAALSKVMLPFISRSYEMLTKKYQHVPSGVGGERTRMLLEVFRNHQTFSVRTAGFNGLGALGVCFGPFIAMDAPNVEGGMGTFSWARTFHHELAHTMTLGLSKGRVPRWLTEGLSTFEETEFDPAWTRGMDRDLFDAFHTGGLLRLAEFDAAFGTPRIIYAYYQGGLESGWLVKTYGLEKVLDALRLFGDDLPQEEVVKRAFGVPSSEIDEGFKKFVAERIAPMKMQPRYAPPVLEKMEEAWKATKADPLLVPLAWARFQNKKLADAEALLAEAQKRGMSDSRLRLLEARIAEKMGRTDRAQALFADLEKEGVADFDLALDLAKAAEKRGKPEDAMKLYRDAIAWFPTNADPAGPRVQLARLLRGGGKVPEAIALLEEHLRHSPDDLPSRRAVIEHHRASGDDKAALAQLEKLVLIKPLDAAAQTALSELLLGAGSAEEALLAADCAAASAKTPPSQAAAHVAAANALVMLRRVDEARERLAEALRISPRYGDALDALKALEGLDSRSSGER